jgi:hypothetical protein
VPQLPNRTLPSEDRAADVGSVVRALLKFRIDFLKLRDAGGVQRWRARSDGMLAIRMTPAMQEAAAELRHIFEVRFGRPMQPDDPLLFDPFLAEPVPFQASISLRLL